MKSIFRDVELELIRARRKFPNSGKTFVALTEEVGEVANAILEGEREELYKEIIQVMTMCVRLIEEGDTSMDLDPCDKEKQDAPMGFIKAKQP